MPSRRLILTLAVVAFLAAIFFPALTSLLTDWWWFQEIGYQIVFTRPLLTSILLFLGVGGLTYATPFGIRDPVFSRDIGFYVFTLPALGAGLGFLSTLAVMALVLTVPV